MFNYQRRTTSEVYVGQTPMGGSNPVRIQSMANVSTMDTEAAVAQAVRMSLAGAEYIRFTAQGEREARNLEIIKRRLHERGIETPLIADIHFNPKVALVAAQYVDKVRINPGNFVTPLHKDDADYTPEEYSTEAALLAEQFTALMDICKKHHTAIRIGVNHGSLSPRMLARYGNTSEAMAMSCIEFLRLCIACNFNNVVVSVKASNPITLIEATHHLAYKMGEMRFPFHLGLTEAGEGEDGRIKSAAGIGTLLADGLGDTVRVSLSEEPEAELPVARLLVDYITARANHPTIKGVPYPDFVRFRRRASREVILHRTDDGIAKDTVIGGNNPPLALTEGDCLVPRNDGHANDAHFYTLSYPTMTDDIITRLKADPQAVAILDSSHINPVGEMRAFMHRLMNAECNVPVILRRDYDEHNADALSIKAAADFGALLTDGFHDGIMLCNRNNSIDRQLIIDTMYSILQAARVRISKNDYISCPGCGRTLFDLQTTVKQVKAATQHLKGLKIAVMGCIVNGPGEMADADYGYVGAGKGKISLFKGNTCVEKNIPENEAVVKLLELINKK
jgi:(E)-4-hydroxy-3-methylbut-2-enyl-diphosphate synthase